MAEEIILTGDDLMASLPSPVIPPDLAPSVLEGIHVCARELRSLFQCIHVNEVEPFCQDQILVYRRCSLARDKELRERLLRAELSLTDGRTESENRERVEALRSQVTSLNRQVILYSAMEGPDGFQARWRLNGEAKDVEARVQALEGYLHKREQEASKKQHSTRFWLF